MAWESMTTDPIESTEQVDGRTVSSCKFCKTKAEFYPTKGDKGDSRYMTSTVLAENEITAHAKRFHYDTASGCYMNDEDRALRRAHREQYRNIVGGPEETANMNRMGL